MLTAVGVLLLLHCNPVAGQILGRCIAGANSPIDAVRRSVRQWLSLGIPASKLVLGLPW
jgi:di-N-acetylchitobiase